MIAFQLNEQDIVNKLTLYLCMQITLGQKPLEPFHPWWMVLHRRHESQTRVERAWESGVESFLNNQLQIIIEFTTFSPSQQMSSRRHHES